MKTLQQIFEENPDPQKYAEAYIRNLAALLERVDCQALAGIMGVFEQAYRNKKRIYFMGNGGSASTCGHFVVDLHAGSLRHGGGGFRVYDLSANVASLTAVANDVGYENIFSSQLQGMLDEGDVVVAISASGNSKNLVKAAQYAKSQKAVTVGLLGFDGGELSRLCDHNLVVRTDKGQYGPVEDVHLVVDHLMATYFCSKKFA